MVKTKAKAVECGATGEKLTLPDVTCAEEFSKLAWAIAHPELTRLAFELFGCF